MTQDRKERGSTDSPSIALRPRRNWRHSALAALLAAMATCALTLNLQSPAFANTAGQTFYVDCTGRAGDGSVKSPWNSLNAVNRHPAYTAGDSILLKRGSTCRGRLFPRGSGTKGSPIVIGAFGRGKSPVVAGGGTGNGTGAVQLRDQAYWTVQDLHITNKSAARETSAYRSGVLVSNTQGGRLPGITLQRLLIDQVTSNLAFRWKEDPRDYGGISILTLGTISSGAGFDGLQILHNRIAKVGRSGVVVSNHGYPRAADRRVRIAYNTVVRSRGDSIILRGVTDSRMDHNLSALGADFWPCNQCGGISPYTANAGIWTATSKRVIIERNEVYGEHQLGGDGVGLDVDISAVDTTVQYNYVHDNEGGGILFCGSGDAVARFNILENNARAAFVFIGSIPAKNTKIYNNTVYSKPGVKARVVHTQGDKGGKGIAFYNNLIFNLDDSGYFVWPTAAKARTNTYIGVHGIGEPVDVKKGYVNPGVRRPGTGGKGFGSLNGYKVTKSVYTMAGSPIPGSVKKDFFGKAINPKKPPRGAAG